MPLDTPLQKGFWGDKIYNLNVLTGNNGSGKTTIMNYIMDTLNELYCRKLKKEDKTVLILEIDNIRFAIILSGQFAPEIKVPNGIGVYYFLTGSLPAKHEILDVIDKTKIIYLANTLNESDDQRVRNYEFPRHVRQHFIYDCSTSGVMRFNEQDDCNSDKTKDLLLTYFTNEHYKQVKFVCDRKQYSNLIELRKARKPVPIPDSLLISLLIPENAYSKNRFAFKKELARKASLYEISKMDQLIFYLCFGCLFAFEQNLRNNWCPNLELNWKYNIDRIHYDRFKKLFLFAFEKAFPTNNPGFLAENSSQITHQDEATELLRSCLSFIDFVFSNVDILVKYLKPKETYMSFSGGFNRMTYEIDMSLTIDNDFEWLIEFIHLYRQTCSPYYFLDFSWGLSSGENNLLRMFSSLYYIFDNDDDHIINLKKDSKTRIVTETILLFLDEADLTYHPEWQRQFISILTAFLPKIYGVRKIKDIQVLLTTHSPLLLGDIPKSNVTYLRGKESLVYEEKPETFGQNIHQILKDGFFLSNGTVGAFAAEKINSTAKKLQDITDNLKKNGIPMDDQGKKDDTAVKKELFKCLQIIDLVAPGVLKGKLMALYREAESMLYGNNIGILNQSDLIQAKMMTEEQLASIIRIYQNELNRRKMDD